MRIFRLLIALPLVLAACSSPAGSGGSAGAEQVTLRLGYFPNVTHATAIVGVENGIFQDKLGSNVTLAPQNPGEVPRLALEGLLSADKGTYRLNIVDPFIQPTFDVQAGALRFFGTSDLNPSLDIRAIHTVRQPRGGGANGRDVRVEIDITGTLAQPQLALRNPDNLPLSESDLLSYLVTGEPALGLDNTGTQVQGLGLRAFANILTNAVPRNVLDVVELQTATPDAKSTATTPGYYSLLNTRAILGKQLGSRWFLGLSTGLCFINTRAFQENLGLQLEYRISSVYSAQAAIEPGSSNTKCDRQAGAPSVNVTQTPPQLGFDLFRNWRF